ncbi:DUF5134 domain-containing protein [Pseudonocardia acidicola]|uniref:DUF5134 domain-containing protein n=1 Tax=Pseudonocardia acidicola TaxID=2724939 RepID=A0ABX1SDU6_9PSEU|nr:DUF5134 domain-containing protein [Pseudonocardia acidicola]
MNFPLPLAVALTVLFAITGAYSLVRWASLVSARSVRGGDPLTELFHLVMSVAMVAMTWAWSGSLGDRVQIIVFTGFGVYFLWRLGIAGRTGVRSGHGRIELGYHVLMAAAMVWMVAGMPVLMGTSSGGAAHAGHSGSAGMASMPDMPGMPMSTAAMSGTPMSAGATPAWAVGLSVLLSAALLGAAVMWGVRVLRHATHEPVPAVTLVPAAAEPTATTRTAPTQAGAPGSAPPAAGAQARRLLGARGSAGCHLLMSLGMAAMLLAML